MPGIVTKRFRIHNAEQFKEAFNEAASSIIYLFIARVNEWPNGDTTPTPTDSVFETRYQPWRDMIAAKRISTSDVSFATDRYDWTSGTVYTAYDDKDTTLYDNQFFVITEDYNVYKCLFNNYGAASTVKPTGTSTSQITTSDGYIWKFMYNVSSGDVLKFVTTSYIPVETLTSDDGTAQWDVQQAASNGSIDIIRVTANGSGFVGRANTFASVTSSTIQVLDAGASGVDDFYTDAALFISSGLGSGQVRTISDYNGTTKTVTVNPGFSITPNSSSTFSIGPDVTVTGDGSGATAYANTVSGEIVKVTMVNTGSDYSKATVSFTDGQGGSGTGATAVAVLSPPGGHGSDPVGELGGFNVIMNTRLTGSESNTFPITNDFRVIGLLKDPLTKSLVAANNSSYDLTTRLTMTGVSGDFQSDELVDGGSSSAVGRVVSFSNTNVSGTEGVLRVINVDGTFTTETVTGNTTSVSGTVTSVTTGDLKPFSGDVIYNEYRGVVSRSEDQIEDIKLVVRY